MATSEEKITAQAARTGETVFLACKYPTGLKLVIFDIVEEPEQTPLGPRKQKVARPSDRSFTARGPRLPHGAIPTFPIIRGFAITPGCPKDLWDKYVSQNRDLEVLRNHVLFAHPTLEGIQDKCREYASVQSGFQPLDMRPNEKGVATDPRIPKRLPGSHVSDVATADDAAANKPAEILTDA